MSTTMSAVWRGSDFVPKLLKKKDDDDDEGEEEEPSSFPVLYFESKGNNK
jgi:hypothetical protein